MTLETGYTTISSEEYRYLVRDSIKLDALLSVIYESVELGWDEESLRFDLDASRAFNDALKVLDVIGWTETLNALKFESEAKHKAWEAEKKGEEKNDGNTASGV